MIILYGSLFKKRFAKLPLKIRTEFQERLRIFVGSPFTRQLNNHSVGRVFPDCRSINITGDCRAIYKYKNDIVTFVNIGTHSELYG